MAVYFDNAATSHPKPAGVRAALLAFHDEIAASAGRGAYREAGEAGEILEDCRALLARLIGAVDPERIAFTLNCTDALNLGLKGVLRPGDHVVTTWMDHNSILRPLHQLEEAGVVTVTRVRAAADGIVDPDDIRRAITPATRMVATLHASNVCGSLQDVAAIGRICREHDVVFLLDAAQTVGAVPIDVVDLNLDLLAFPGHKALLGPLGTGALWMSERVALRPLREGGTGSKSEDAIQPDLLPDRFEAGSHNLLGLAGLRASVGFLLERDVATIARHEHGLNQQFLTGVASIPGVTLHGPTDANQRVPVWSVTLGDLDVHEVGRDLDRRFGIKVRSGLHCAPLAHQTLGTFETGTVRFSAGHATTEADVTLALHALEAITSRGTSDRRCLVAPST